MVVSVCDVDISIRVKCDIARTTQCSASRGDIVFVVEVIAVSSHCGDDASAHGDLPNPMKCRVSEVKVSRFVEL